jgi:site-specific recombinase XerD
VNQGPVESAVSLANRPKVQPATIEDLPGLTSLVMELFALSDDFTPDQDAQERGLALILGKGQKERWVPIATSVLDQVRAYISACKDSVWVFPSRDNQPLTRQQAWNLIKRLVLRAGIAKTVSPHQLRHSFATHLLQGGMNLRMVQSLLGHADLSTTQIYTAIENPELERTVRIFHPKGRKGIEG